MKLYPWFNTPIHTLVTIALLTSCNQDYVRVSNSPKDFATFVKSNISSHEQFKEEHYFRGDGVYICSFKTTPEVVEAILSEQDYQEEEIAQDWFQKFSGFPIDVPTEDILYFEANRVGTTYEYAFSRTSGTVFLVIWEL